jgi:hypothetical protein
MQTPAILGSLQIPATAVPAALTWSGTLVGQTLQATLEAVLPEGLLLRLADGRTLQAQGNLPFPPGSTLLLKALPLPEGAGVRLQVIGATQPQGPALLAPLVQGEAAPLLARLQTSSGPTALGTLLRGLLQAGPAIAEEPATWSGWLQETLKTLADPALSPREAAFHQLQAKEGTGLFEIPLPWAPQGEPLRLWVEQREETRDQGQETVHRLFLSVPFSGLGEVRVGLEQWSAGLKVRLWAQDPAQLTPSLKALEAELSTLGRPVEVRVLPLPQGLPDLRALAGAPPLQAMG